MMTSTIYRDALLIAILGLLVLCTVATPAQAAEKKQYAFTTIRGKLSNLDTGAPMISARLRFTPTDPDAPVVEAETDENGQFEARGLGFGFYVVEIETANGDLIRGVNALPLSEGERAEVLLKLSDKIRSSTGIENEPDRFMAVVTRERKNWPRFWKQLGIFLGLTVATGAAVF
jgi:hypothetical protein